MPNDLQNKKIRFLHVSNKENKLCRENFRKPHFDLLGGYDQSFKLDGCFYLSKALEDGTSNWLQYREYANKCTGFSERRFSEDGKEPDKWLTSTYRYYLDVDFSKHKIYIVDNAKDFMNLLIDYGHFRLPFCDWGENFERSDVYAYLIIYKFYEKLDEKYDWIISSSSVQELIKTRTKRNMPLIQIFKKKVIIPNNKITNVFLADLIRSLNYYEKIIGNVTERKRFMEKHARFYTFNYWKLNRDGYKGIHFTENIIKPQTEPCKKNLECECYNPIIPKEEDVLDITRRPVLFEILDLKIEQKKLKDELWILKWLGSEQLIVWDWVFD